MNALLIPVRSMTGAKNRLSAQLDETARTRLTLAMLADMITAARGARLVDAVYVVSADSALLERARGLGAETLEETPRVHAVESAGHVVPTASELRGGLNRAVFAAANELARRGVRRLLTIPGDVPLIAAVEIDELFVAAGLADVVLAPSGSGTGTNGLLTTPATVIAPRFEGESLVAHVRACETAGLQYTMRALPGFALDIDTVEDLRTLAACGAERESVRTATALLAPLSMEATAIAAPVAGGSPQ